ncbi:MAG: UDP-2,3-diacylglucosamine diphosphatase LpxI [Zavarzinella sp.]
MPPPVGLIAGWGDFPVQIAKTAQSKNIPVICLGIRGMAEKEKLAPYCHHFAWTRLAAFNRPVKILKKFHVSNLIFAGKIHKITLFRPMRMITLWPDWRMLKLFFGGKDNADDTITLAIINELQKEGLSCISPFEICPEILVQTGAITAQIPTEREMADIQFGCHLAKEMGRLDIGQSVCVRDRAVLAVEAIEGTDACIRRAGELCRTRGGFVVVKVAKPNQDPRFDVPTVGKQTIETMRAAGGTVLAIEGGNTIMLEKEETVALAEKYRIKIIAVDLTQPTQAESTDS